jgi:copper(I)-binding protein
LGVFPNTAAYLTITNTSDQSDKLVRVECDESKVVEIHNHINDNGVMKMRPVDFIEIGKNPVEMKPGGLHIMLMGLKDSFQGKETIPLTLYFEKAGSVKVDIPIRVPGSAS